MKPKNCTWLWTQREYNFYIRATR